MRKSVQEQRPSEREFLEAALRFLEDDYPTESQGGILRAMAVVGNTLNNQQVPMSIPSRQNDEAAVVREQLAEGYIPGDEDLADFARNQLRRYAALRKSKS